jgi:hypothetical protein
VTCAPVVVIAIVTLAAGISAIVKSISMDLFGITLIAVASWVVFMSCILCLLKAARVADDSGYD